MANTIANSTAGNAYFTIAGSSAITSTTQPRQNLSVIAGVVDTSLTAHPSDSGIVSTYSQVAYTGNDRTSIIRGLSNTIRSTGAITLIRCPGSDFYREGIRQVDAARTYRIASAIRSGVWNMVSGSFSTTPATANDFSAWGNDDEADSNRAIPGYFSYAFGTGVTQRAYPARTQ